jgi:hypothetical protein
MPLSESKLLSFWANPKLDTITSLEELLPSDLIMERLQITFNHRTGAIFVDRYRLGRTFFTLVRSTREVVIVTTLNQYGLWQTSEVFHNNGTLDAPVKGHLLRTYRTTVSDDTRDMSGNNYQYQAQETDATTHETRTLVFDSANDFRKIAETYTTVGKAKPLLIEIHYAYSDDFSGGALPSIIQVSVNNKQVAEAKAVSFDPDSRAYVVRTRLLPAGGQEKLQAFQLSQTE